ncbi:PepSY domain-containing protein [Cupriavidus basilensis]
MVDPVTLAVKGSGSGASRGCRARWLMPTLFQVHHYLLSGETGRTILGIAGMLLLVMVICGVAMWWPKL